MRFNSIEFGATLSNPDSVVSCHVNHSHVYLYIYMSTTITTSTWYLTHGNFYNSPPRTIPFSPSLPPPTLDAIVSTTMATIPIHQVVRFHWLNLIFSYGMLSSWRIYRAQSFYNTLMDPIPHLRRSSHWRSRVSLKSPIRHMLVGMLKINNC